MRASGAKTRCGVITGAIERWRERILTFKVGGGGEEAAMEGESSR